MIASARGVRLAQGAEHLVQGLGLRVVRVGVGERRGEELLGERAEVLVPVHRARANERGFQRRGGGERVSDEGGARGVLAIEPLFHAGLLEREGIALGVDAPQRLSGVLLGEPEEALGQ